MIHLSLDSHPFLGDHRLEGRPVLPLAWALDAMAATLTPPFALADVRVERGLILFNGEADVDVRRDEQGVRLVEVRPTGRTVPAFSARVSNPGEPPGMPAAGRPLPVPLTLDQFYAHHAYHGPRMRAIERIDALAENGIRATLRTSVPRDWQPADPRPRWALDPLAMDGLFQLALLWATIRGGPRLVPKSIEEVSLLEPLCGTVEAELRGGASPISCHGLLRVGGRPVAWLREVTGLPISAS